jgi:hypothetical protein
VISSIRRRLQQLLVKTEKNLRCCYLLFHAFRGFTSLEGATRPRSHTKNSVLTFKCFLGVCYFGLLCETRTLESLSPSSRLGSRKRCKRCQRKVSSLAWSHTHTAPLIRLFAAFLRIKRALSKVMIAKMNDALL